MTTEAVTRRLIVSGDDFGLHEQMNRGVIEAHRHGVVTSASVVACGEAFDDAARRARGCATLDVGVHLTLVEEAPLCPGLPTLATEGRFPRNYAVFFVDWAAGRIEASEVEKELDAQIGRAKDAGLNVTHLDSHQHTHFFPGIAEIVVRLARRHGIGAVRGAARIVPSPTKFSLFLAPLAKRLRRLAAAAGIRTPDTLVLPSPSGRVDATQLVAAIEALPEGVSEIVAHPGAGQSELDARYPSWRFRWEEELRATQDGSVREALDRNRVSLARFDAIA
jgi:predicted glycoside hydrolase/deacetylase ChbG (UPF0249 family)